MKLKILGSSSSGNCYLLQNKESTLILECGLPYKTILRGLDFDLNSVVGCLVTHEHKDHSKAVMDLMKAGIYICTSQGTINVLDIPLAHRLCPIKSLGQIRFNEFTILPFETEHDAAEPLGFLVHHADMGKLLFITDSYYCQYNFTGLNHIMIECNFSDEILWENLQNGLNPAMARRLLKSHFSLNNVKAFLKATDLSQVRDITLLHLSDGNSNAREFKAEIERLTGKPTYVADKGLEIELGGM